jgi:phage shock protein C
VRTFLVKFASKIKTMEPKKLFRSREHMLAGVCGGIAEYFNMDKTLVRLVFAALSLAYFTGILFYLLMWIIVPVKPLDAE